MAAKEFIVSCFETGSQVGMQTSGTGASLAEGATGSGESRRKWNGAAEAKCGIEDKGVRTGAIVTVFAETAAEAITGTRQLYPGLVGGKIFAAEKGAGEEK